MSSGELPKIPEPRGNDPDWFRQMKIWCTDVVRELARTSVVADGRTIRRSGQVLSAIPDFPPQFKVDQRDDTSVFVRGGAASRWDGGDSSESNVSLTVDGGGTNATGFEALSIPGITTSQWIKLEIDDPLAPTTLTAAATGSATIPTSDDGTVIPLAFVVCDGGKITHIFQAHTGPWYLPMSVKPDAASINRNPDLETQWRNWHAAIFEEGEPSPSTPLNFDWSTSLFGFKKALDGLLYYITLEDGLGKLTQANWNSLTELVDLIDYEIEVMAPSQSHSELTDIDAGTAGDDHNLTQNAAYLLLEDELGAGATPARNPMGAGNGIGDGLGAMSVNPHDRELSDGLDATLDWLNKELDGNWTAVGDFAVDAGLGLGDLRVAYDAEIGNDLDVGNDATVVGGVFAEAFYVGDGVNNEWSASTLTVNAGGSVEIASAGALDLAWSTLVLQGEEYSIIEADLDIDGVPTRHKVVARAA